MFILRSLEQFTLTSAASMTFNTKPMHPFAAGIGKPSNAFSVALSAATIRGFHLTCSRSTIGATESLDWSLKSCEEWLLFGGGRAEEEESMKAVQSRGQHITHIPRTIYQSMRAEHSRRDH